jgi:hypothetical protein
VTGCSILPAWDHRWCDDRAAVPHLGQLPIQTISSRAGFIPEVQTSVALLKAANQATNRCRICVDLSDESDLALPAIFGYRHSVAHPWQPPSQRKLRYPASRLVLLRLSIGSPLRPALVHSPSVGRATSIGDGHTVLLRPHLFTFY